MASYKSHTFDWRPGTSNYCPYLLYNMLLRTANISKDRACLHPRQYLLCKLRDKFHRGAEDYNIGLPNTFLQVFGGMVYGVHLQGLFQGGVSVSDTNTPPCQLTFL